MNIESLIRPNIRAMRPYSSARDEFSGAGSVYLDANENPVDTGMNRYPDPYHHAIREKLAPIKGVSKENIFLGNGSDEPIDLLIRLFCTPGKDAILSIDPTYGMYKVAAAINDVDLILAPLRKDFSLDSHLLLSKVTDKVKMIFLCSPNNPSGNLLNKEEVIRIIEAFKGIVVLDEAYIDFTSDPGFLANLDKYPNLVILQTFSKAWGLAGLRVGMAFASAPLVEYLHKIKPPYNLNILSQHAVMEALTDAQALPEKISATIGQRTWLANALDKIEGIIEVFPSDANFLLVRLKKHKKLFHYLLDQGVIVRDRSAVTHGEKCLRFTVGLPEENQQLILAIKQFYA